MKDDRLRVPVEDVYVHAIGLATYAFATLEWNAVWCCERIAPGAINTLPAKTAGAIAERFVKLVEGMPSSTDQADLLVAAKDFEALVKDRNGLMHGKPGTDTDGGQRLFRHGTAWSVEMINDAADRFTACSMRLNALFYGFVA
jgi:hypothetical protein